MDRRLYEAVLSGDVPAFLALLHDHGDHMLDLCLPSSLNTVLHLAARFGHQELTREVLNRRPEMAAAENGKMETPLHEASREGRTEVVRILLGEDPRVVYKVNKEEQSALFVASERGRVEVVKLLIDFPRMLMMELDGVRSSLHVAASAGHADTVREILEVRSDFAWKKDAQGCTPLHLACAKGHLEIVRELLKLDSDLSTSQDNDGRTPLHCAAVKGRVNIIDEVLSTSLESAEMLTGNGETVLHLAVRNNQYEAVKYLTEKLNVSELKNTQDKDGNTVLHLAIAGKLRTMALHLLKLGVDVNAVNCRGHTALDIIEFDASNSGALAIIPVLQEAGAKRCDQLSPRSTLFIRVNEPIPQENRPNVLTPPSWSRKTAESPRHNHHRRHTRHRRREKQLEIQNEGLRNARNTITVVGVLIATVTFAAGINPPGGYNQVTGRAIMGGERSFKIFMVCNVVALFLSLGIVIVLVSVIPYRRKPLMKLLVATHKVMWVSTSFMAGAYIAAMWTILPLRRGTAWVLVSLVGVAGGCTITMFMGLGVLLVRHWVRKWEWKRKVNKHGSPHSCSSRIEELQTVKKGNPDFSSNSDVDSSDQGGYHLY